MQLVVWLHEHKEIVITVLHAIDESLPFELETDASEFALAAVLNQQGRPVAFFSRTLHKGEIKHSSVEKEAMAIVESVRHWRHYLTGRCFKLQTDQRSVVFMFDHRHKGKIKNEKIMRWRMELSCYRFDIEYKPGVDNVTPDVLSRCCFSQSSMMNKLSLLHEQLCHPGVTRLYHYCRSHNMPISTEDIRNCIKNCRVCAELKPHFHTSSLGHLIKATKPFERLNVDFKGPLPSDNQNVYFLNIIDEYSRFPFVFPCKDTSARSVINCFYQLFSIFGMPASIHSDRGSAFISKELRQWLTESGVSITHSTAYNPQCNGQIEKSNDTVWRGLRLSLKSRNLPISKWQTMLPVVLHSIRSLLCTATNSMPHERFFSFTRRSSAGESLPEACAP